MDHKCKNSKVISNNEITIDYFLVYNIRKVVSFGYHVNISKQESDLCNVYKWRIMDDSFKSLLYFNIMNDILVNEYI